MKTPPTPIHPMRKTAMTRILSRLAVCTSMATFAISTDAFAGRGGGMQRGGGGGMQRGGGGMSHSPSFSQPRSSSGGSHAQGGQGAGGYPGSGSRPSGENSAGAGNRNSNSTNPNAGAAAGAGYANRNQSGTPSNAGAAAAGAGYSNRNQSGTPSNAGAAAAGAGYSNRNQSQYPNAGAAAAGAGYSNRNQSQYPNAGAAAAGAGYANRNQSQYPDAGAAAVGAGYANRNQNQYPYGGAAAGAAYANNNGYWNGNYGNGSLGTYGGVAMASPSYGYGSSPYVNPYAGVGAGGGGQVAAGNPSSYDYSQPVNTAAEPPDVPQPADLSATPAAQARQAFQSGDYAGAVQFTQQALGQTPNDTDLHQLLALGLFAQGSFEQAAAPLYAVLAVGPGWNWTTLIGNYPDADTYTGQLRALEAFVRANPGSAKALLVEAYHYISQGHPEAAVGPLKAVVSLQPNDGVSAHLLETIEPAGAPALAQPLDPGKLTGVWVAQTPPNATITLTISDDTNFTWAIAAPGKPPVTIAGPYTLADGVLTLSGQGTTGGPLVGKVGSIDDRHMNFKAVGGPPSDPGLQFAR
ncbi:tetratricopeptide repeat protein (plasmid) [Tundrisphaera lichenicola]|uniref:tetratricopeptide repeat protein n=1 Tax=Tundrisphaera lichenicola TaxID=2029860 RepID=UPI003EBD146C